MIDNFGICPVDGCTKKALARFRGACEKHYKASRKTATGIKAPEGSNSKLNAEQCAEVKKLSSQLHSAQNIAKRFGVDYRVIKRVLSGTYKPNDA